MRRSWSLAVGLALLVIVLVGVLASLSIESPATYGPWLTAVTAAGTCLATIFVAVQAYLTRAAIETAEQASHLSAQLLSEAIRTRIDSRTPSLHLRAVSDVVPWPPLEPSDVGDAQPLTPGQEYHLPKAASDRIRIVVPLELTNRSNDDVDVNVSEIVEATWNQQAPRPTKIHAPAGSKVHLQLVIERSVSEWADIAQARENGDGSSVTIGHLWFSDRFDQGVIDRWEVHFGGTPLIRDPQRDGVWRVRPTAHDLANGQPMLGALVLPASRTYYLSKADLPRLLPEVAAAPAEST